MRKYFLWMLVVILTCGLVITSCSEDDSSNIRTDEVEVQLQKMTLREKVGQMFYVRPEVLDTTIHWQTNADLVDISLQEVNARMKGVNEKYPVGVLSSMPITSKMKHNLVNSSSKYGLLMVNHCFVSMRRAVVWLASLTTQTSR